MQEFARRISVDHTTHHKKESVADEEEILEKPMKADRKTRTINEFNVSEKLTHLDFSAMQKKHSIVEHPEEIEDNEDDLQQLKEMCDKKTKFSKMKSVEHDNPDIDSGMCNSFIRPNATYLSTFVF